MTGENGSQRSGLMSGEMNLIFRARMLWRDLATWMTIYLVSTYGNYPNQDALRQKLYDLPQEYDNLLRLVFGDAATTEYVNLVSTYIVILQSLFHAQLEGDGDTVSELARRLYRNLDQQAAFLARLNPYWEEETWRSLLHHYNHLLFENSMTLLTEDFNKNVDVFGRLLSFSSVIGDYFSEGIIDYLRGSRRN